MSLREHTEQRVREGFRGGRQPWPDSVPAAPNVETTPENPVGSGGTGVTNEAASPGFPGRREPSRQDLVLSAAALRWMAGLPKHLRPVLTSRKHPHVVNRLCESWSSPTRLRHQFSELLIDRRGTRRGFSFEVFCEISRLEDHYAAQIDRAERLFWDTARLPM